MILEYKLEKQDFIAFQLFTASKNQKIENKKRNGWIFLSIAPILVAIYFYWKGNIVLTIYCAIVAIACALFYPKYFKWRYKNHYKNYIQENYKDRFGQLCHLEIKNDSIYSKDDIGDGTLKLSAIEQIDETTNHFFVKFTTASSLIIPKHEVSNTEAIRNRFKSLNLAINNELNWKWD